MGNSCSSSQRNKNKDSGSTKSEESPSYQAPSKGNQQVLASQPIKTSLDDTAKTKSPKKPSNELSSAIRNTHLTSISDSTSPGSPGPPTSAATVDKNVEKTSFNFPSQPIIPQLPNTKSNKIILYICAADSQDCRVEKSILHNEIYPELRKYCRNEGFEIHIVDLHWNIQEKTPEPSELVLHELNRHNERGYLIPVILLNQTLGAAILPKTIEIADFESAASSTGGGILRKWYQHDSQSQPPCYRLLPASAHITGFQSVVKGEREKATLMWQTEVEEILEVLLSAFHIELRDSYLTTVIEQEVHNTVLMSQEMAKRTIWLNRVWTHLNQADLGDTTATQSSGETELKRRLEILQKRLKTELKESHIRRIGVKWLDNGGMVDKNNTEHTTYLDNVTEIFKKLLTQIINSIIEEHNTKENNCIFGNFPKDIVEEIWEQNEWAKICSQTTVNRQEILDQLTNYIGETPVLVSGSSGTGKTTLLARFALQQRNTQPSRCTIIICIGLTKNSSTLENVLRSMLIQIMAVVDEQNISEIDDLSYTVDSYKQKLEDVLKKLDCPMTIILDGLDQLVSYDHTRVDWIPKSVPDKIKFILSVNDESDIFQQITEYLNDTSSLIVQLPDLDKNEAENVLTSSVLEYNHSVDSNLQSILNQSVNFSTNPLYIKVLAWQTSWCIEFGSKIEPKSDLSQQITSMFNHLEFMFGKKKVEKCLSVLTCSKWGITDSEMVDILSNDEKYHTSNTYLAWAGAVLFWCRLVKGLWPFLRRNRCDAAFHWRDSVIKNIAKNRYSEQMVESIFTLQQYFFGKLWINSNIKARITDQPTNFGKYYNRRKLEELPFLSYKQSGTCLEYIEDNNWIFEKLCGTTVFQVIEDIKMEAVSNKIKSGFLLSLRTMLEKSIYALNYDGKQFYSFLSNLTEMPDSWTILKTTPPVDTLMITNDAELNDVDKMEFDFMIRLPDNPYFIVTVTTKTEEICVWHVEKKCKLVRTIKGIPQPTSLKMVNDYKAIVLSKRELRIYDLNNGILISKLKGVMNQKMPYFGLHDDNHLVALSRNRMYVILMNMETSDCVTTFKAGEDRFLNSLLVSGDGRMLVCGDETQKPFPLLVWNLESRKLLYDLRIPGHDFITSLSAITYQGHYVCCVAKEVDEPTSANFIVVYDLQSGTLFKKWKPGVDTCGVDISSLDSCVVSGHCDGTILVWDLVTGNCRCKLTGHCGPVSFLTLDANFCLSTEKYGKTDKSIRLWNLTEGCLTAVFSPKERITCLELTNSGKTVVMALENSSYPVCLRLQGPNYSEINENYDEQIYGDAENTGKTFIVNQEPQKLPQVS